MGITIDDLNILLESGGIRLKPWQLGCRLSGVYTATILSWLVGMDWKKSFPAIALGVVIAGIIVILITLGVMEGLRFLTPD